MNYKRLWKTSLVFVIAISTILVIPSLFKSYELSDAMIRTLGTLDIIGVFLMTFALAKSNMKH